MVATDVDVVLPLQARQLELVRQEAGDQYGKVVATSGNAGVRIDHDTGLVETSKRGFPSVILAGVALQQGRWYYEATLVEAGIGQVRNPALVCWCVRGITRRGTARVACACAQIGWGDLLFVGSSYNGVGVGDDKNSWAYDGRRLLAWFKGSKSWGAAWKPGDVIGIAADVDAGRLRFSLNGSWDAPMGTAFRCVAALRCAAVLADLYRAPRSLACLSP